MQTIIQRFIRFNYWANQRLADWLGGIDRQLLYADTGSSFPTIDKTIQHMTASQDNWEAIILRGEFRELNQPDKIDAIHEVLDELIVSSGKLLDGVTSLPEAALQEIITVTDSAQSRYEYILHVVNHSSYHRGQIVSMIRSLGYRGEVPTTDYDAYLWWIENEGE